MNPARPRETTGAFVSSLGGLPPESTSFVGRQREIAEARKALGRARVVTLTGTGGVGKTRLAVQLARGLDRSFPDGSWFVELDRIPAGTDVADAIAGALQLSTAEQPAASALLGFIDVKAALLVLDNCEHVLQQCADLVAALLRGCPNLTVLATSREPLALAGETVFPVPALEVSGAVTRRDGLHEAVALFVERARASVPEFLADEETLPTILDICARLEGLPLAIELAAVRLRVLSPDQILARLNNPLRLLTRGGRDLPERQRTLRASIEWSYELCTPEERWLWSRLSVFAGAWDLAAAEGIDEPDVLRPGDVVDVLQSLIEKSIITSTRNHGELWYGMVRSIREFGLDLLAERGELVPARRAHRDWYITRLYEAEREWIGPNQGYWLDLFQREFPNIRAALDFTLGLPGEAECALELTTRAWRICWQVPGRLGEHRRWLARALAETSRDSGVRAEALALDAVLALAEGDRVTAEAEMAEAHQVADRVGDPIASSLVRGSGAELMPDSPEALDLHRQAALLQVEHLYLTARANSGSRLVLMYDRMNNPAEAARVRGLVLKICAEAGETYETSYLLLHAGIVAAHRGDAEAATELTRKSLRIKLGLPNPIGVGQAQETLAVAAILGGDHERAAVLLGATHELWRSSGGAPPINPPILPLREEYIRRARVALGESRFAGAYDSGRAMTAEASTAFALGETPARVPVRAPKNPASPLTAREHEVAGLVAEGLSDKQIARRLFISLRTAEGHVQRSLLKLGLTSRTQLAVWITKS